jgi:thymidylate synthase
MTTNNTDYIYQRLLNKIITKGVTLETRNSKVISEFNLPNVIFSKFPLVTVKKTAIKKAIREMEWFLSGTSTCPEELLDWWDGQLSFQNCLFYGYGKQFRYSTSDEATFDQIEFILEGLRNNPNSRRLLISLWNPGEMANITEINNNPNTPTVCHSIVVQFFVRNGELHIKTYQRSADMLLGVPHNWVQSWAKLLYFAYHSNLQVGSMTWIFGDAHIYGEETHTKAVEIILDIDTTNSHDVTLEYKPKTIVYDSKQVPIFKADDFKIIGTIPEPIVTHKINLL